MSLLFESIACLDGQLQNLSYHLERMNLSRQKLLKLNDQLTLKLIEIPAAANTDLWKCRVSYAEKVAKVEFTEYAAAKARNYKLIRATIDYPYKLEDRQHLNQLFANRGPADDIIIVVNEFITDSSYGNLVFFNGYKWVTPATPLLKGTMRAKLLDQGMIIEEKIRLTDLPDFKRFMMINALNPFDKDRSLPTANIIS